MEHLQSHTIQLALVLPKPNPRERRQRKGILGTSRILAKATVIYLGLDTREEKDTNIQARGLNLGYLQTLNNKQEADWPVLKPKGLWSLFAKRPLELKIQNSILIYFVRLFVQVEVLHQSRKSTQEHPRPFTFFFIKLFRQFKSKA